VYLADVLHGEGLPSTLDGGLLTHAAWTYALTNEAFRTGEFKVHEAAAPRYHAAADRRPSGRRKPKAIGLRKLCARSVPLAPVAAARAVTIGCPGGDHRMTVLPLPRKLNRAVPGRQ
jgi:hypothetical protein